MKMYRKWQALREPRFYARVKRLNSEGHQSSCENCDSVFFPAWTSVVEERFCSLDCRYAFCNTRFVSRAIHYPATDLTLGFVVAILWRRSTVQILSCLDGLELFECAGESFNDGTDVLVHFESPAEKCTNNSPLSNPVKHCHDQTEPCTIVSALKPMMEQKQARRGFLRAALFKEASCIGSAHE